MVWNIHWDEETGGERLALGYQISRKTSLAAPPIVYIMYNTNTIPKSQFSQMQCLFLAFSTAEHYLTDDPRDRHAQSDLSELPLTPGS